ncbi:MAG: tyrosine-protein phosphatase [Bradyrhizobium sp.]|nr:tyrosine-protein phosphatase [Bradyrhizobium sp.]
MSDSPARHLNLSGASNFRDLGGYLTRDGRTVRWRQIFRSNHLGHLTDDDAAILRGLGVKSAFDFRGTGERAEAQCGMSDITVHSLPVEPTVVAALRAIVAGGTPLSAGHAVEVMRDSYRSYVQQNTPRYRTLFAHLLEDRAPLVIHCTAGKDRTGFACALILHTLGVPEEVISEDYLLTNQYYRRDPNSASELPDHIKQVLGSVQPAFLGAAFEAIDADYGSLENYLRDGVGLGTAERTALAARYLQA